MAGNLKYQSNWLIEWVEPEAHHDKYYEILIVPPQDGLSDWLAIRHWGPRGKVGQIKIERGKYMSEVIDISERIFQQKTKEGYEVVFHRSSPGVISDSLMHKVAAEMENPREWKQNGWAEAVTTTDVLVPDKVQVDISGFIQELLACQNVTAEQASKRSTFRDQIETLRAKVAEAEAAAELMDTVYSRRLA